MKKLFKKIMDKMETCFLNRAGIAITPRPLLSFKEINIREFVSEVFISYKTLAGGVNYKESLKSAIRKVAHKIGEELLTEGCLIIKRKEADKKGVIFSANLFCTKLREPISLDELCEKIWDQK